MLLETDTLSRAPAFFVGHGNPMHAIEDNDFTRSLRALGEKIPKPKAIIFLSAHWTPPLNAVAIHDPNQLIYDMSGFPDPLYQVKYPVRCANNLIPDLQRIIPDLQILNRNLDHGVWSVLVHLFPDANVPVIQLGINSSLSMQEHFDRGRTLRALRDEGVMIIGSGNVTHNLAQLKRETNAPTLPWVEAFDDFVKNAILTRDFDSLIAFEEKQRYARLAHPTTEHYLPLLYIGGASYDDDTTAFPVEHTEHGSLSMRNWLLT